MSKPQVGLIMGSQTDWSTMREAADVLSELNICLLYTSPSPRDYAASRMPSSA